ENIKQSVTEKIDALKSSVREKFQSIKQSITEPIEKARDAVRSAIDRIKGIFNTTISFPRIKLPHFRITAGVIPWGIGGKGTPPSIGIDWYDKGGIFDAPTIIGVGERRPEFVGALDDLREIVREESGPTINYGGVTINVNGTGMSAEEFARKLKIILDRGV
ncbi:MAG: phage tail tape measure protein, partial [Clostridia bacterium]|nr:phage tail tape measure protein [Clostridia bacterium]